MELWLDTIQKEAIERAVKLGFLHGITTNPSILAKTHEPDDEVIKYLLEIQPGVVAVQVKGNFIEDGNRILEKFPLRIVLKIPLTEEGLQAIVYFSKLGAKTMATTIFDSLQVFLAAKAGATYAALYLSRMQDEEIPAFMMLREMVKIIETNNYSTKILAASIRTTDQIKRCAALGIGAITLKDNVFYDSIRTNVHTERQLEQFAKDHEQKRG